MLERSRSALDASLDELRRLTREVWLEGLRYNIDYEKIDRILRDIRAQTRVIGDILYKAKQEEQDNASNR